MPLRIFSIFLLWCLCSTIIGSNTKDTCTCMCIHWQWITCFKVMHHYKITCEKIYSLFCNKIDGDKTKRYIFKILSLVIHVHLILYKINNVCRMEGNDYYLCYLAFAFDFSCLLFKQNRSACTHLINLFPAVSSRETHRDQSCPFEGKIYRTSWNAQKVSTCLNFKHHLKSN